MVGVLDCLRKISRAPKARTVLQKVQIVYTIQLVEEKMKQRSLLNWIAAALYLVAMYGVPAGTFAIAVAGDTPVVMAQDDAADDGGAKKESILMWTYHSLGPLYSFVFLGISFALVALGFKYILALRVSSNVPEQVISASV